MLSRLSPKSSRTSSVVTLKALFEAQFCAHPPASPQHYLDILHYSAIAIEEVEKLYSSTRQRIEWLSRLNETPFTQNTHYLSATREKVLAHYHAIRRNWKPESRPTFKLNALLENLASVGLPSAMEALPRLFSDDKFLEELIVMAETRAYFQIAYKVGISSLLAMYRG